jgi:hypothetical protein
VRRSTLLPLIAAGAAGQVAQAPATMASPSAHAASNHGRMIPAARGHLLSSTGHLLSARNDDESSLNWSGYAQAPGSGVTGVTSTFTVPDVSLLPPGFAANWTGIGGWNTSDLIQAGTSEDEVEGDYAWYEILPDSETQLTDCSGDANCTVNPGDVVTVDIHNVGTNLWSVALTDAGHWSWQKNISYVSSESSAEWIFEAPTLVVQTIPANTGTNYFTANTYTDGSGSHAIQAQGLPDPIAVSMGPGLVNEATPSGLASDGESFNVCAYQQSCPTP